MSYNNFTDFVYAKSSEQKAVLNNFVWYSRTKKGPKKYVGWSHRIITSDTLICFFIHLKEFLEKYKTLSNFFKKQYEQSNSNPRLESVIRNFCREILSVDCPPECKVSRKTYTQCKILGTIIPSPQGSSAFKTICLFLRWMVRPPPDLMLWGFIPTSELLYPLDSGVIRVLERLKLLTEKETKWQMVIDATNAIKTFFDKDDPVKFDFALSRLGILRFCQKQLEKSFCALCPFGIKKVCPSAVPLAIVDQFYHKLFTEPKIRQISRLKGEYLELKVATVLVTDGYQLDMGFKYLPVLPKYRNLLIQHNCMIAANRMELDVVVRKITDPSNFKVVECKYHRTPVSKKDVECFGIKCANFREYLRTVDNIKGSSIEEQWFVALNGFSYNCQSTAAKYNIKLLDRTELNRLLSKKGRHTVPVI